MARQDGLGRSGPDWASIREPIRPSKYYQLKCVDLARKLQTAAEPRPWPRGSTLKQKHDVSTDAGATEDDLALQTLQARKKLYKDIHKIQMQLQLCQEKLVEESRQRLEAIEQTKELRRLQKVLAAEYDEHMLEVQRQQTILRNLRAQVRHHSRIAETGQLPEKKYAVFYAGGPVHYGYRLPMLSNSDVANSTNNTASIERPVIPRRPNTSHSYLSDRKVPAADLSRALGVPQVPAGGPGAKVEEFPDVGDEPSTADAAPKVNVEELIEMLPESLAADTLLARLRHPSGAEVVIDRNHGRVCYWKLGNGNWSFGTHLNFLHALGRDQQGPGALVLGSSAAWRFVSLDYSNNELSANFVLEGAEVIVEMAENGTEATVPLRFRRKLVLGFDNIDEEFAIERYSMLRAERARDVSLSVGEEEAVKESLCKAAADAMTHAEKPEVRQFRPAAPDLGLPMEVWLPASTGLWSIRRRFTVPGAAPLTDGIAPD
eukprot:TRINITY_DN36136_c0_g1_i1.p1 TRINITY_DN36136_c0_g1~~TRINITY_DN36136_c0_g1_i1.p1  ORF type:complete len:488 (-),score=85.43 TRINITY_DN36136_c0_g1_i1:101-1564(-)